VEQPAGSSCEAAPEEPSSHSAAVEEPVDDTTTVTEAEPAPAAVPEAVSTEVQQELEEQQQEESISQAPADAADKQPRAPEACMAPEQQASDAAEAPAAVDAQLDSSSTPQQDASADVSSHAIAGMKSELSLAEPSSTVIGQASFLQECSGSSHQLEQQQPALEQPPTAVAAPPAATAPEQPAAVPVLEQQHQGAPGGAEQSADVVMPSPVEDLQLAGEESGLLPTEAVDFEPPLMPEASEEPVLPLGVDDGNLHWLDGSSLLSCAWFGLQSLCWPGRRWRLLCPGDYLNSTGGRSQPRYHNVASACAILHDTQGTRSPPGCSVCLLRNP
jgi:hypothetical protein